MKGSAFIVLSMGVLVLLSTVIIGCTNTDVSTKPTSQTQIPIDPNTINTDISVGTTLINVKYSQNITPYLVKAMGGPKYDRKIWEYNITFTDLTGKGYSFYHRSMYITTKNGEVYTKSIYYPMHPGKETFNNNITPFGSFSDTGSISNNVENCTFCDGTVTFYYTGKDPRGIEVIMHLNNKSAEMPKVTTTVPTIEVDNGIYSHLSSPLPFTRMI